MTGPVTGPTGEPAGDWGDERLDAAFAARAASTGRAPADLAEVTVRRLAGSERRRPWFAPLGATASAALVLAISGIVVVSITLRRPSPLTSPSVPPTGQATAPASTSTPFPTIGPTAAAALPIRTVSEALAIRDSQPDPIEITVAGWLRSPNMAIPCPAPFRPMNPARIDCPMAHHWIVENEAEAGLTSLDDPGGPGFRPSFALVDTTPIDRVDITGATAVSITGHFHDRRARLCESSACDATFVVDRIETVNGVQQPVTTSFALGTQAERGNTTTGLEIERGESPELLDARIAEWAPGLTVIGRRQMSLQGLADAEPELLTGWAAVGTSTVVTTITALDPGGGTGGQPSVRTFLYPDGAARYYEVTADGPRAAGILSLPGRPGGLVTVVGQPITVSEAIDHRDRHLDDTELLVRGQAWGSRGMFCSLQLPGQPILDQCSARFQWIAEDVPVAVKPDDLIRPTGPAMNLVIPPESANLALLPQTPADRLVLGHFDDHRAAACPDGKVDRCRHNFVVDAILDPSNPHLTPIEDQTLKPAPSDVPRGTATWAALAAGLPEDARADRLISAYPVAADALTSMEPDLAGTSALQALRTGAGTDVVWLVHFLDTRPDGTAVVRTRLVADGPPASGQALVYDATSDGLIAAPFAAVP